jgi:hypothetical protein
MKEYNKSDLEKLISGIDNLDKKFADPKHWIKNNYAKNVDGEVCPCWDKKAICWCLSGAMINTNHHLWFLIEEVVRSKGYKNIVEWNDSPNTSFEDLKSLIKDLYKTMSDKLKSIVETDEVSVKETVVANETKDENTSGAV